MSLYSTDLFFKVTYRIEGLSFAGELETSPQTLHSLQSMHLRLWPFWKADLCTDPNIALSFKNFLIFFVMQVASLGSFSSSRATVGIDPGAGWVEWIYHLTTAETEVSCFARWATSPPSLSHPEGFSFCLEFFEIRKTQLSSHSIRRSKVREKKHMFFFSKIHRGHLLTLLSCPEGVPRASLSPTTAVARCCWGRGLFEVHVFLDDAGITYVWRVHMTSYQIIIIIIIIIIYYH